MTNIVFSKNIERAECFISRQFVEQRNFEWTDERLTAVNPRNGMKIKWCSTLQQIHDIKDVDVIFVDCKISKDYAQEFAYKNCVIFHI